MHEFPRSTSQAGARVKFESQASSSQGPTIIFLSFFLLVMTSGCYSLLYDDVLVVNGKINFQVCNIFRFN